MTISSEIMKSRFSCNGSIKEFPCTWRIQSSSGISIYLINTAGTANTYEEITSNFAVTPTQGSYPSLGFTVEYPVTGEATASGYEILIIRKASFLQPVSFKFGGTYNPKFLEEVLDSITIAIQKVNDTANRSIQLPIITNTDDVSLSLPDIYPGRVLAWSDDGTGLENADLAGKISTASEEAIVVMQQSLQEISAVAESFATAASSSANDAESHANAAALVEENVITMFENMNPPRGARLNNTIYVVGDIAYSLNLPSWAFLECVTSGASAATEPTYTVTKPGTRVADGTTLIWAIRDIRKGYMAGIENNIATGRKIGSISGLTANITAGKNYIAGNLLEMDANSITFPARKACLLYDKDDRTTGYVAAQSPVALVDANTVGMWIFNQPAGTAVPNSAVGVNGNTLAVANPLTPTGTTTQVDGIFDYSLKLDGTSGYFVSGNYTGIPIGAAEREVTVLWSPINTSAIQEIMWYGGTSGTSAFNVYQLASNNLAIQVGSTTYDTGFAMSTESKYLITVGYDGTTIYVKINGSLIYKVAVTLATTATVLNIGGYWVTGYSYGKGTIHFLEVRNKISSDYRLGSMANSLMLPCFYNKNGAVTPTVPTDYASLYHEYLMSESSGTTVADSNTASPLNGTATGTAIVDSEIGLTKARKLTGSGNYISLGNFACGSKFTVAGVVNLPSVSSTQVLWSNRNSGQTAGNSIVVTSGGIIAQVAGANYTLSNQQIPLGTPVFICVSINGASADVYVNSGNKLTTATIATLNTTSLPAYIGYDAPGAYFSGIIDYMMLGNFAMSQAEVAQYYTALMATGRRSIIDDVLPAGAVSVGYAQTNSSKIIEYNDTDYKYGRREKAFGGNRRVFLGWKYFSGATDLSWDNPFGTGRYKAEYHYAQDAKGTNEVRCIHSNGYDAYGILPVSGNAGNNDTRNITAHVYANGTYFNQAWQSSGYIGCYAEVMEDYKGVDVA